MKVFLARNLKLSRKRCSFLGVLKFHVSKYKSGAGNQFNKFKIHGFFSNIKTFNDF